MKKGKELKVLVKKKIEKGDVKFEISSDGGNEADTDYIDFANKVHGQLNSPDFQKFLDALKTGDEEYTKNYMNLNQL